MRMNRSLVLAAAMTAMGLVTVASDAGATSRTLPGFAGVLKSQSQANWNNAYEFLEHTTSGADGVAYNLPVDTSQGYASATLYGNAGAGGVSAKLLALDSTGSSVWQSTTQSNSSGGNFSLSFSVYVPTNGWAALEVGVTGANNRINDVLYNP